MLQVARLAPALLGESRDLVRGFFLHQLNEDGGFQDRAGASDLYYTVFGLEGLAALGDPSPASTATYLRTFGGGDALDFVHLTCLARSWATVAREGAPAEVADALARNIERFRTDDGGYAPSAGAPQATAYGCFLALGALEDLRREAPDAERLLRGVMKLQASDGGFANHSGAEEGSTPATAATVMVMRHLDAQPDAGVGDWLLARFHDQGGFRAAPRAPVPDLLSTATALHALTAMHVDLARVREPCLDFLDSLWTNRGGFYGSWVDQTLDCEYTYYGLLALGHLSL